MRQNVAYDEYLAVIAADVVPAAASKMAVAFSMTSVFFLIGAGFESCWVSMKRWTRKVKCKRSSCRGSSYREQRPAWRPHLGVYIRRCRETRSIDVAWSENRRHGEVNHPCCCWCELGHDRPLHDSMFLSTSVSAAKLHVESIHISKSGCWYQCERSRSLVHSKPCDPSAVSHSLAHVARTLSTARHLRPLRHQAQ